MSGSYGPPKDTREMSTLLRAAVEHGITFFDTAELCGPFLNEELAGEALAPFRGRVAIATKFGFDLSPGPYPRTTTGLPGLTSRPDRIKQAVEGSLKRLRVEVIDLLYRHRVDPIVPIEDRGLRRRKRYRLFEELGIGFVPYSSLGKGFLTDKIDETAKFASSDFRSALPRFTPETLKANQSKEAVHSPPAKDRRSILRARYELTRCSLRLPARVLGADLLTKLHPARLVTREIALGDVTDTLERMTRFEKVGFEVITRFRLRKSNMRLWCSGFGIDGRLAAGPIRCAGRWQRICFQSRLTERGQI